MKYFLDTEFIEDGKTIDLISIGIVCEDGRELYCCNQDAKLHLASPWVRENVLPHLPKYGEKLNGKYHCNFDVWHSHSRIKEIVKNFVLGYSPTAKIIGDIEFWAYYADYDWVAFCQLFGTMMDLPNQFPKLCMDLKQLSIMKGNPKHPEQKGTEHNALEDARWNKDLYYFLQGIKS